MPTPEEDLKTENTAASTNEVVEQQSTTTEQQPPPSNDKPAEGGDKPAGSTETKTEDQAPKSALEAVLKVVGKGAAQPPVVAEKKEGAGADKNATTDAEHRAAGEDEKDWISREEYAKLSPVVRRRISKLTDQRNAARDEIKVAGPKARTYDELQTYCAQARISHDDFAYGLQIMSLVRTNPAEAWRQLQPLVQDLQAYVGEILPTDLAKEVDEGKISEGRAKELAAARRERERLARGAEETTARQRHEAAVRQYDEHTRRTTDAVTAWEQSWKASDPDYAKKSERVWERMVTLLNKETEFGKKLVSAERSVEIAEQAKKDVEGWLKGLVQQPREIKAGPSVNGGGGANVTAKKQPTTALEAAQLALAR